MHIVFFFSLSHNVNKDTVDFIMYHDVNTSPCSIKVCRYACLVHSRANNNRLGRRKSTREIEGRVNTRSSNRQESENSSHSSRNFRPSSLHWIVKHVLSLSKAEPISLGTPPYWLISIHAVLFSSTSPFSPLEVSHQHPLVYRLTHPLHYRVLPTYIPHFSQNMG